MCEQEKQLISVSDVHCPGVNEETKNKLISLLNRYPANIALTMEELGKANSSTMTIELVDHEPVHYHPRRLSYMEHEKVKTITCELEKSGIIRESNSPYASPITLVKKKNGETR